MCRNTISEVIYSQLSSQTITSEFDSHKVCVILYQIKLRLLNDNSQTCSSRDRQKKND